MNYTRLALLQACLEGATTHDLTPEFLEDATQHEPFKSFDEIFRVLEKHGDDSCPAAAAEVLENYAEWMTRAAAILNAKAAT